MPKPHNCMVSFQETSQRSFRNTRIPKGRFALWAIPFDTCAEGYTRWQLEGYIFVFNFFRAQVLSVLAFLFTPSRFCCVLTGAWEMQVQIWNIKYTKIWWTSKAFAKQSCDKWDIRRWCKWLEWSDTSVEGITSEAHRSRTILQLYEHLLKI